MPSFFLMETKQSVEKRAEEEAHSEVNNGFSCRSAIREQPQLYGTSYFLVGYLDVVFLMATT